MGASRKACRSVAGQIQAVAVPREQCPVNVLLAHGYGRATRCMCAPCGNFKAPHSAPVTVTHSTAPPANPPRRALVLRACTQLVALLCYRETCMHRNTPSVPCTLQVHVLQICCMCPANQHDSCDPGDVQDTPQPVLSYLLTRQPPSCPTPVQAAARQCRTAAKHHGWHQWLAGPV
jgi:hypothetical protein